MITCRLRKGNFEKSSLAEYGCDARSFAGDREGCCVGGTWRDRAVSVDRVAHGSSQLYLVGHLMVGEFTVTGVPLFLLAFLVSS